MTKILNKNSHLFIVLLSMLIPSLVFYWQGLVGFNMADEGFLWYGIQRVSVGEIPIRDFLAYHPGRYYLLAVLATIFGDTGIAEVRAGNAVIQAAGLYLGLRLINESVASSVSQKLTLLVCSSIILTAWMYPWFKAIDISLSIGLISVISYLILKPSAQRYFITGLVIGLIAVFGRNHGVYGAVGCFGAILLINSKNHAGISLHRGIQIWVLGIFAGFSPILMMGLFIPDFATAFWADVIFIFESGATNLTLPIPWPWTVEFSGALTNTYLRKAVVGIFFIGVAGYALASLAWVAWHRHRNDKGFAALASCSFLSTPYAHYAFSRADLTHLCLGIFPFLVGCLISSNFTHAKLKVPLLLVFTVVSLWVMHPVHPGWERLSRGDYVPVELSGSQLFVAPQTKDKISFVRGLKDKFAPDDENLLITPYWPSAYAVLERKSPKWDIYALWPRTKEFEMEEIERIKNADPAVVLILDYAIDGRADRRFKATNPLTDRFIVDHYDRLETPAHPHYRLYKAFRDTE